MTNVHTLWTGTTEPGLLEHLMLASFRRHGCRVHLWTFPHLFPKASRLFPGTRVKDASAAYPETAFFLNRRLGPRQGYQHYSDLFRKAVVLQTGEWWSDLDVTLLRPLPALPAGRAAASAHDIEGYSLSLFACPRNFGPLRAALARCEAALRPPGTSEWMASARCFREAMGGDLPEILYCGDDGQRILDVLRFRPSPVPDWPAIHWCGSSWPGSAVPVEGSAYERLLKDHQLI